MTGNPEPQTLKILQYFTILVNQDALLAFVSALKSTAAAQLSLLRCGGRIAS